MTYIIKAYIKKGVKICLSKKVGLYHEMGEHMLFKCFNKFLIAIYCCTLSFSFKVYMDSVYLQIISWGHIS